MLDEFLSLDWINPTVDEHKKLLSSDTAFKTALYFAALTDWILFFKVMNILSVYEFNPFTMLNLMGIVFLSISIGSTQFAVAHELFHKLHIHRIMGTIIMSKLLYMHFTYEHIWGHHRKVATP